MVLSPGEKVFIVTRRHFDGDTRRHFVGEVDACSENCVRVTGYAYVGNSKNSFDRRTEERTRIFSLIEERIIINILPMEIDLAKVQYGRILNRLYLSDGQDMFYDIDEFRSE